MQSRRIAPPQFKGDVVKLRPKDLYRDDYASAVVQPKVFESLGKTAIKDPETMPEVYGTIPTLSKCTPVGGSLLMHLRISVHLFAPP